MSPCKKKYCDWKTATPGICHHCVIWIFAEKWFCRWILLQNHYIHTGEPASWGRRTTPPGLFFTYVQAGSGIVQPGSGLNPGDPPSNRSLGLINSRPMPIAFFSYAALSESYSCWYDVRNATKACVWRRLTAWWASCRQAVSALTVRYVTGVSVTTRRHRDVSSVQIDLVSDRCTLKQSLGSTWKYFLKK